MSQPKYGHVRDKYQFKKYTNPAHQQANFLSNQHRLTNILGPSDGRLFTSLGFHFSHIAGLKNTETIRWNAESRWKPKSLSTGGALLLVSLCATLWYEWKYSAQPRSGYLLILESVMLWLLSHFLPRQPVPIIILSPKLCLEDQNFSPPVGR